MALLSAAERKKLPSHAFAIPSKRAYPIHDKNHARDALARVSEYGTPAEKAQVKRAVAARYPNMGDADKDSDTRRDTDKDGM